MIKSIFISYSRNDVEIVRPVVALLRVTGANVFRDEDSIPPGKRWRIVLADSISVANVVVVFWSKNSARSDFVKQEYEEAARLEKDIVPVLLDEELLTPLLKEYQYIDFRSFLWLPSGFDTVLAFFAQALLKRVGVPVLPEDTHTYRLGGTDLFLAYHRDDAYHANVILEDLKKAGLTSYAVEIKADRDHTPDAEYNAMLSSKVIATVASRQALQSEWFKVLSSESWAMQKIMIPFLVNCQRADIHSGLGVGLKPYLRPIQFDKREDFIKELSKWPRGTDTQQSDPADKQ